MEVLHIHPSIQDLVEAAAELFITTGAEAIKESGYFSAALSGGGTPIPVYQYLAADSAEDRIDWKKVHFFWGDERTVPPDDKASNYYQAYKHFLEPLAINKENVHRMKGELDPIAGAEKYQRKIIEWFKTSPPRFDLIFLGLGDDGHTASLFPHTDVVTNPDDHQWVAANHIPPLNTWRITFTPQLINAAAKVVFLISGENKAHVLKQVRQGPYQPETYPAQLINPHNGQLIWLVDDQAGKDIK